MKDGAEHSVCWGNMLKPIMVGGKKTEQGGGSRLNVNLIWCEFRAPLWKHRRTEHKRRKVWTVGAMGRQKGGQDWGCRTWKEEKWAGKKKELCQGWHTKIKFGTGGWEEGKVLKEDGKDWVWRDRKTKGLPEKDRDGRRILEEEVNKTYENGWKRQASSHHSSFNEYHSVLKFIFIVAKVQSTRKQRLRYIISHVCSWFSKDQNNPGTHKKAVVLETKKTCICIY